MNTEEFNSVFNKYRMKLFFYAKKYVEQQDAEDTVSKVFIKLWQAQPIFNNSGQLQSWLYTTTKNSVLDLIKSNKAHKISYIEDETKFDKEDQFYQDLTQIESEVFSEIQRAINILSYSEKNIINLFYFQKKTLRQIAKINNTMPSTIANQLMQAREKLKYLLDPNLMDEYFNQRN